MQNMRGSLHRKTPEVLSKFAVLVLTLATVTGFATQARAESMHSTGALASGAVWAQDPVFNNSVWVHTTIGTNQAYASGIAIDPWNVLTPGHVGWSNAQGGVASQLLVGTGSNYLSNPGTIYEIDNFTFHPQWNGTIFSQTVDLMILHVPEGIPGMLDIFDFDTTALGEKYQGVGVGQPGTGDGTWHPVDGDERALHLFGDGYGSAGGTVSTNYLRSRFLPLSFRNEPMAGGLTVGDSGAGVFDLSGNLVGMGVGFGGTPPGYFYDSFALRLDLFEPWINDNRIVPEPGTMGLLAFGAVGLLRRRR